MTFKATFNAEDTLKFQYRKRYEVTCDGVQTPVWLCTPPFQYRKRYEVTCDSMSGRPQKQKAQIMVLENLLETKHAIALFRLSLHTPRICNDPAKPYAARLAAIRGKSENLPRFFASERFSTFHTQHGFSHLSNISKKQTCRAQMIGHIIRSADKLSHPSSYICPVIVDKPLIQHHMIVRR